MHKYFKKIFASLLIIPMSLIFVSCNTHENSGIVVDGKEINDGVIDYIPKSISFKRNAQKTLSLVAKTIPSASKGKIYCYLSESKALTNDNKTYSVSNLTQSNSDVLITNTPTSGRSAISIVADGSSSTWSKTYYLNFFAVNVDGSMTDLLASCQVDRFENVNYDVRFSLSVKNATNYMLVNDNYTTDVYPDGDYYYSASKSTRPTSIISIFKYYDSIADFFNNTDIHISCKTSISSEKRRLALTTDFMDYIIDCGYTYGKKSLYLSDDTSWSNFGDLFGITGDWQGLIEDYCFENMPELSPTEDKLPAFAILYDSVYFNGGTRSYGIKLNFLNKFVR